jgi:hypothetical protein
MRQAQISWWTFLGHHLEASCTCIARGMPGPGSFLRIVGITLGQITWQWQRTSEPHAHVGLGREACEDYDECDGYHPVDIWYYAHCALCLCWYYAYVGYMPMLILCLRWYYAYVGDMPMLVICIWWYYAYAGTMHIGYYTYVGTMPTMLATTLLAMLAHMLHAAHRHDVRGSGHHRPQLAAMLITAKIDLTHPC